MTTEWKFIPQEVCLKVLLFRIETRLRFRQQEEDVLNRLGYMERKGSGFEKILSGYEFQLNYDESKKPRFRSDRYQFTVVMPNLNYNVPQDVPQDVLQDDLDMKILELIRQNSEHRKNGPCIECKC